MAHILNSLVISAEMDIQRRLESVMSGKIDGYSLSFTTYGMDQLEEIDRDPDLIFIENSPGVSPADVHKVLLKFPNRTAVVLDNDPETRRKEFLKSGVDEVMSLTDLQSDLGRHMIEKLVAWKDLAAAEAKVEQSEERFRDLIEHSHDMIILLDDQCSVLYTSPAFGRQMGYQQWEVLGQILYDFVHEEDRLLLMHSFRKLLMGGAPEATYFEFQFRRSDGEWRTVEAAASNLLRNINVQSIVFNLRDITAQKQQEEELEDYRRHLEELVARRTRELAARTTALEKALDTEREIVEQQKTFVSMVSHEFRTPLTIIDGNAQIISSRGDTLEKEVLQRRATTIRSAVDRLIRLIETVLSSHMLDSGKLILSRSDCDIARLIRDISQEQQDISPMHKITVKTGGTLPLTAQLDEKLMRHILTNLLSNAVKYAPKSPEIDVVAFTDGIFIVIEVIDKGLGIPAEEIPKIFGKYFRASTSGGIPGSGLGLSLVKQFVEMHQGTIDLKSQVGAGTTVSVKLPVQ